MRLAVVSPFVDRHHGTERALAELLVRLAREYGCEIHLYAQRVEELALSDPAAARAAESGAIYWHKVPSMPGPHVVRFLGWMFLNGLLRRWHASFGGVSYDLVLSPGINCLHPDVVVVHALFRRLQKLAQEESMDPVVESSFSRRMHRRAYYGLLTALERRIYGNPRVSLAAVSLRTAALLKRYFQREDVSVIPNGVDTACFSVDARLARRAEARQRRGFRDEDSVLLLIGNDWRVKGLPTVLQAMLALRGLPLRLLAVGSDAAESYRLYARRLGVQDLCEWELPRQEVLDFYAAADLYVSPSLEDSFGLPVAEAMACGLPVITSAFAGVADFLRDGVEGFVIRDPRDAGALAGLIRRLQEDPQLRRRIGDAAAEGVRQWTWDRNAAAIWVLLSDAKAKKRRFA